MEEDRRFVPWVTVILVVLNVAGYIVEILAGADPVKGPATGQLLVTLGGNFGPLTLDGEPWRLLTSMFLHGSLLHLGSNMIFGMYQVGQAVEHMYGRASYLALYLVSGLAGSLASAARGAAVSVGASGAIFGLLGGFVAFLLVHRRRLDPDALKKQVTNLAILLGLNVVIGFSVPGIDLAAHVGGLVAGLVAGLVLLVGRERGKPHLLRAVLVAVIGSGAIVGATYAVPHSASAGLQFEPGFDRFAELESLALDKWNSTVRMVSTMDDREVANVIEHEILPRWTEAETAYTSKGGKHPVLLEYIAIRREAWTTMLTGLRANDQVMVEKGATRMNDADKLLKQLE